MFRRRQPKVATSSLLPLVFIWRLGFRNQPFQRRQLVIVSDTALHRWDHMGPDGIKAQSQPRHKHSLQTCFALAFLSHKYKLHKPYTVSRLLSLLRGIRTGKRCLQIQYVKDLVEIWPDFSLLWETKRRLSEAAAQTDPLLSSNLALHCQPAATHHDHNNGAVNLRAWERTERCGKQTDYTDVLK